ncbi:MAG TPA: hypothetical protein VK203_13655 [Nostocaceae cyanobacterium]|nr:hypothetical protein [Nostocaceae cyanobacterium]
MRQYTNLEMIEQIYHIFQNISIVITQAEEVLIKTEEINSSVELQVGRADLIRLEIAEITARNQEIDDNIQRFYWEICNIHNNIIQKISEIPRRENLHCLHQEFNSVLTRLNEIQIQVTQIDQGLLKHNQPLAQEVDSSQQLLSQVERDKQAITELAQNLENRLQRVSELQTEIEQILRIEAHLDTMNSEISSLALEVKNNKEALQKMQNYIDNTRDRSDNYIWELRGEMERLRENFEYNYRDIKSRFQIQIRNQQRLDNWLFGVTFGIAFIAITLFLGH